MRHSAPKFHLLALLLIAALACPWPVALACVESSCYLNPTEFPTFPAAPTVAKSVLKTSIDRTRPSSAIDESSALPSASEEDDESDGVEITACSAPLDLFNSFPVHSPRLVSVTLVEPRSPKIHSVIRFCRLLC